MVNYYLEMAPAIMNSFPGDLTVNTMPPQLQITDFKIADISLKPGQAPLTRPIEQTEEIRLNYKQDIFSIDFAGIHYSSIDENSI